MSRCRGTCCPTPPRSSSDGALSIGGCDLEALAAEFGTPLFVYDEEHLRARCREAVAAFGDGVAYATKAFLCRAMARLAHEEGMELDVATGGELHVALAAGVPADRLVMHGNNKSPAELPGRLEAGVGRHRRRQLRRARPPRSAASARGCRCRRCCCGSPPGSRPTPTSSSRRARTTPSSGSPCPAVSPAEAVERATESAAVDLVGIHVHIGCQVFVAESFGQGRRGHRRVRRTAGRCPSCRSAAASASPTSRARRRRRITAVGQCVIDAWRPHGVSATPARPSRVGRSPPRRP